jgi:hypothetical protein
MYREFERIDSFQLRVLLFIATALSGKNVTRPILRFELVNIETIFPRYIHDFIIIV